MTQISGSFGQNSGVGVGIMKNKFDLKKLMQWLGVILRCPICGIKYSMDNTQIIDSEESNGFGEARILIHSDCNKCKSSVMFNIEVKGPEVYSVGMVTDLTQADSARFQIKEPISVNEVIGIHKALKSFDGDFIKFFQTK